MRPKKENLAWKFFITVIPITIIPIIIAVISISQRIYTHLEEQNKDFYRSLLTQVGKTIDQAYTKNLTEIQKIFTSESFQKILLSQDTTENLAALPSASTAVIEGDLYMAPLNLFDNTERAYSTSTFYSNFELNEVYGSKLFQDLKENFQLKSTIGNLKTSKVNLPYQKSDYCADIIVPYYPEKTDSFKYFLITRLSKTIFSSFFYNIQKLEYGTLYIIDRFDNIIIANHPSDNDYFDYDPKLMKYYLKSDDEETCPFTGLHVNEFNILNTDPKILQTQRSQEILKILSSQDFPYQNTRKNPLNKSRIIKYNGIKYLPITGYAEKTKIKLLYFQPVKFIRKPINDILIFFFLITLLIIGLIGFLIFVSGKRFAKPIEFRRVSLEMRNKNLLESNEQRTNFFINLAHETKTPLTLINNYLDKYMSKKEKDKDLEVVHRNIKILTKNIVNILDVEKLQRGEITFNHDQIINLSEILTRKVDMFKNIANKKSITFITDIEKDTFLKIDPFAIDRIINNFIENAIKYNTPSGTITVSLAKKDKKVLLTIKDTGIGIPENQKKRIFEPYYQVKYAKKNTQGLGMGLAIVRNIANSIGAEIYMETAEGAGTSFTITFEKYDPATSEKVIEVEDVKLSEPIDNVLTYSTQTNLQYDKSKKTIFIVEDNIEIVNFLISSLFTTYNIFYAENGIDALHKIEHMPIPDIIISDIMMDEMDGINFYKTLSYDKNYNHIPFIFLTARTQLSDKIEGLKLGAIDYITKPFSIDVLIAKIKTIIKKQEQSENKSFENIEKNLLNFLREKQENNKKEKLNTKYYEFDKQCKEHNISKREKEVAKLLIDGLQYKEIAYELHISEKTVSTHVQKIYSKFDIQSRTELINLVK